MNVHRIRDVFSIDDSVVSALAHKVPASSQAEHHAWTQALGDQLRSPIEYLLPRICRTIEPERPPFISRQRGHLDMSPEDLRVMVEQLGPWDIPLPIAEGVRTMPDATLVEAAVAMARILYRRDLICGTVAALLGDEASRTSVLDIGCKNGFFSLDLADRGFGRVRGIDLRQANIAQAQFLAEHFGVDDVEFAVSDADALPADEQWDVVLNLGVLYHVVNPLQFIRQTHDLCRYFAIIDTLVHREPVSGYVMFGEKDVSRYSEGREVYELHPTYRGAIDTIRYAGFREVFEIVGEAERPHPLYRDGERRCFLALK